MGKYSNKYGIFSLLLPLRGWGGHECKKDFFNNYFWLTTIQELGPVGSGWVWLGLVGFGPVWSGLIRSDPVWSGPVWSGLVQSSY